MLNGVESSLICKSFCTQRRCIQCLYIFLVILHMLLYAKQDIIGGRSYPVRHYPIAIRLRDRKGRAILCIALFPQSGDSSGAILGVRSVALLHPQFSANTEAQMTIKYNTRAHGCAWIIRQSSDAAFVRKYCVFAHKFPRNSILSLLRIQRLLISQPTYR